MLRIAQAASALRLALPEVAAAAGPCSVKARRWASSSEATTDAAAAAEYPYHTFRVSRKFKQRTKRERVKFRHHGTTCGRVAARPLPDGMNMPLPRWQGAAASVEPPAAAAKAAIIDPQADVGEYDPSSETVDVEVLTMKLGFFKDVQYRMPDEVKAIILEPTLVCLYGTDKNQVTQLAATLRAIKPPDPYKGAGVRLLGEEVKLRQKKK